MTATLKLVCCDVDGTLTDGTIYIGSQGETFKGFNVKDGMGIALAREKGVHFAIITGRESDIVSTRARELKITEVHQNCSDKSEVVKLLKAKYNLSRDEIAFIGDDVNDIIVKDEVGMLVIVKDGHHKAKALADVVLETEGGRGAIREFVDRFILDGCN
jgi:3-deoxy-D-manno-octulosonate 8-phosphate phosphatase (KDO 8-P phosphatase)